MARGGKRPGAGRKREGITRKVSLTLTADEWRQIEESGAPTVAAFIKDLMKEVTETKQQKEVTESKSETETTKYTKKLVDELWSITLDNWKYNRKEPLPDQDVLQSAKDSLFIGLGVIDGEDTPIKVKTKTQYICPFTNKRYSSFEKMIRSAIDHLIKSELKKVTKTKKQEVTQEVTKDEADEVEPRPPAKSANISLIEIRIFWNQITRGKQKPEVETYLRTESVKREFFDLAIQSKMKGDKYICPMSKKGFKKKDEMLLSLIKQIIEKKKKEHLQWVLENS
jgi:hypothetical protein